MLGFSLSDLTAGLVKNRGCLCILLCFGLLIALRGPQRKDEIAGSSLSGTCTAGSSFSGT